MHCHHPYVLDHRSVLLICWPAILTGLLPHPSIPDFYIVLTSKRVGYICQFPGIRKLLSKIILCLCVTVGLQPTQEMTGYHLKLTPVLGGQRETKEKDRPLQVVSRSFSNSKGNLPEACLCGSKTNGSPHLPFNLQRLKRDLISVNSVTCTGQVFSTHHITSFGLCPWSSL